MASQTNSSLTSTGRGIIARIANGLHTLASVLKLNLVVAIRLIAALLRMVTAIILAIILVIIHAITHAITRAITRAIIAAAVLAIILAIIAAIHALLAATIQPLLKRAILSKHAAQTLHSLNGVYGSKLVHHITKPTSHKAS